ncbi:MAG: group 1 truncated hemoglobin [Acidobacteria bacterium]|nr:MAG: group 1 truncated hemoglobin [Acidobacteriota bacterium]
MRKNLFRPVTILVLLLVSCGALSLCAQSQSSAHQESLYKRLGGYDALAAVTDDFIKGLATDKQLSRFFKGASADSQKRIRQLVLDQLCAATGGPCLYIGRSMKTVHTGLGITEEDWDISVKLLTQTLDKFKVGKTEKDDLFKILLTLKPDIVEKR